MPQRREWYTYHFKVGSKIIRKGITKNLIKREEELQVFNPDGHIFKVGGARTEKGAREWKRKQKVI